MMANAYPVPPWMFGAVQNVESGGNPYAVSPAGAQGPMQVMPQTASNPGFGVQPAMNNTPQELQRVGQDYLSAMMNRYHGNQEQALQAYNWGPGNEDKLLSGQIQQPPAETQAYVPKVMSQAPQAGFPEVQYAQNTMQANDASPQASATPQMPKMALMLEAEKRGILPDDKLALLTEARKRGLINGGEPQAQTQQPQVGYAEDMLKSGSSALAKGVAGAAADPLGFMASFPRALVAGISRPAGVGYQAISNSLGLPEMSPEVAHAMTYPLGGDPESKIEQTKAALVNKALPSAVQNETGMNMNYVPQTKPGQYAASVGGAVPYMAQGLPPLNTVGMGIGSEAGKDITSLFTDNPKYQEAGGIVGGAGGAMGFPSAMDGIKDQFTQQASDTRPQQSLLANQSSDPSAQPVYDASLAKLKEIATNSYTAAESKGAVMAQSSWDKAVDDAMNQGGAQTAKGKAMAGNNYVTDAQERLSALKGSPTSLQEMNEIDDDFRDRISQAFRAGADKQAVALMNMRDTLRNASMNAAKTDMVNAGGFEDWRRGDQLWTVYRAARDVQDIIDNGERADVPSTAIKNGFKAFIKNENNLAPFNAEERQALAHAAKTGIITGALKGIGSKIITGVAGGTSGFAGGGIPGAILGAAVGQAVGFPFRAAANARQTARGQNVIGLLTQRPVVQEALSPKVTK